MSQLPEHVDGSPVTMYDWGMPSVYHPDKVTWLGEHDNITYIFPPFSDSWKINGSCLALIFLEPAEPVLLDIPCDLPVPNAAFLCERHTKTSSRLLYNNSVTKVVCPHDWIAILGNCYTLYKLNLTSRLQDDSLCPNGEIVNYSKPTQMEEFWEANANAYSLPNEVLVFLPLWLENTDASVSLMNNVLENLPTWEKYVVVTLPPLTEHMAVSALSALSGMKRYITSFPRISSLALHVFCRTPQDHVRDSCETNQFTCDDGTCILGIYQCDGTFHCQDRSDEDACRPFCHAKHGISMNITNSVCAELCQAPSCMCDGMYFQCRKGSCVPWSHVCDCKRHCQDGSDEQSCLLCYHGRDLHYPSENGFKYVLPQKEQGTFVCGNREMIPLDWVGDLVNDCHGTPDDELLYHMFLSTNSHNFTGCTSGHTTCMSGFGKCFPVEATCAFERDKHGKTKYCPNGAHFLFCSMADCQSRYKCSHDYCIAIHMVCDGKVDCPQGEDEGLFCERPSCPGMLRCSESSVCVHARHIGDGTSHCVISADDERV